MSLTAIVVLYCGFLLSKAQLLVKTKQLQFYLHIDLPPLVSHEAKLCLACQIETCFIRSYFFCCSSENSGGAIQEYFAKVRQNKLTRVTYHRKSFGHTTRWILPSSEIPPM